MNTRSYIFLFLMLIKGMRTCSESKISLRNLKVGKFFMRPSASGMVQFSVSGVSVDVSVKFGFFVLM